MEWLVLGSGSIIPTPKRGPAGHALKAGKEIALFDLGPGCLEKLVKAGWDYKRINHVFISHFTHCDHVNDLSALFMAFKVACDVFQACRATPLNLYGPKGLKKFVKDLQQTYPFLKNPPFKYHVFELKDGSSKKTSLGTITAFKALHPKALSFLLTGRKKVFYSGDTGFHEGLALAAKNADLLVLECSFARQFNGHLNPSSCGEIASKAKPKKLLLTHFYDSFKGKGPAQLCRRRFKGKIIEAKDLLKVKV